MSYSLKVLSVWGVLCWITQFTPVASAQSEVISGRDVRAQQNSRMRVIELKPESDGKKYFTVAGAVKRSGVFHTNRGKISLDELIESAGGLAGSDRTAVRVMRQGQSGFQLFYVAGQPTNYEILAGDIVVVVPHPNQVAMGESINRYLPVVCVGVIDRPVVLPLALSIRRLEDLLIKLRQPQGVKEHVQIVDPLGNHQSTVIRPGTVLFFDPFSLDRAALAKVEEFPPSVSLDKEQSARTTPASSVSNLQIQAAEDSLPQNTPTSEPSLEPVLITSQTDNPRISISSSTRQDLPKVVSASPSATPSIKRETSPALPVLEPEVPPGNDDIAEYQSVEQPMLVSTFLEDSKPEMPQPVAENDRLLEIGEDEFSLNQEPLHASKPEASTIPELAPPPPVEGMIVRAFPRRDISAVEPQRVSTASATIDASVQPEPEPRAIQSGSPQQTDQALEGPAVGWGSKFLVIVLSLAGIVVVCLGGAILWSRHDRHALRNEFRPIASNIVEEEPQSSCSSNQQELQIILDDQTPIIVEDVVMPRDIPLHGVPVAHRRIIVHNADRSLKGPHFNRRRSAMSEARVERVAEDRSPEHIEKSDLPSRQSLEMELREAFRGVPASSESVPEAVEAPVENTPVPAEAGLKQALPVPEFWSTMDVVEPIGDDEIDSSASPLERALRKLAREKQA